MKLSKKLRALAVAIPMMVISTAAAVTGTLAWFTANNAVKVTGMTVSTKVDGNLFIAPLSSANASDDLYKAEDLESVVSGKVEPVSTVNAEDWFYTKNKVKGDGSTDVGAQFETLANSDAGKTAFSTYYAAGTTVVPYVDYAFYLKATSSAANQNVVVSDINFLYNNAQLGANDLAWRVALYAEPVAQAAAGTTVDNTGLGADSNVSILRRAGATYFSGTAVSAADATTKAATFAAVTNLDASPVIGTITTAGATQRYKVVVRLFLEGNDTKCNNETYVTLTQDYSLSVSCGLDATAASYITSVVA